jgi:predicted alpha/beta superfamily hydrolase
MELSRRARSTLLAACAAVSLALPAYEVGAQTRIENPSETGPLSHLPGIAGDYFKLPSAAVGRDFHIFVSLPQSYEANSEQRYPVVYVLDGDSLFPIIAPTHLFLTIDYDLPEAVIVGIAYGSFDPSVNRRGYDFTLPAPNAEQARGGAPAFHAFLKDELSPLVERRYRVDSRRRVLFGQSRGGGMVLYSAFTDPDLFWGRIASNPAFDPGRELFFSAPEEASRDDLGLVVTSGSGDIPVLREAALEWFSTWDGVDGLPWKLHAVTIEDGAHASFSPSSYRAGMLRLFNLNKQ